MKLTLLTVTLALVTGLAFGYHFMPETIVTLTETKTVTEREVQYVTKTAIETKFITELKEFESREVLKAWLESKKPDRITDHVSGNCVDHARWLYQKALDDGYYSELWVVDRETYKRLVPYEYRDFLDITWPDRITHMVVGVSIDGKPYILDATSMTIYYSEEFYYMFWTDIMGNAEIAEKYYGFESEFWPKEY